MCLMFGKLALLPLDVTYETNTATPSSSTPGEYAMALQKQLRTAYDLVRARLSNSLIKSTVNPTVQTK